MALRGIRGAITVKTNSKPAIVEATTRLLTAMIDANKLKKDEIASIIFTATADLNAEFPATAARKLGLNSTPLLCAKEIDVKTALKKCVRVLILYNTNKSQKQIKHLYLDGAKILRPDLED